MKFTRAVILAISLLFISYFLSPVSYSTVPSVHAQTIDELADQLKQKREEIKKVESQLAQAQQEEKTLQSQLNYIDAQNKLTQLKIEETEFQLKKLDKEITDLSGRVERLSVSVDAISAVLLERIVNTYKYSNTTTLGS